MPKSRRRKPKPRQGKREPADSIRDQIKRGVPASDLQHRDGQIGTEKRAFHAVVNDLRQATYSVLRIREAGDAQAEIAVLGSGFFISRRTFLTCHHVVNDPRNSHQDGDTYRLVAELANVGDIKAGRFHDVREVVAGNQLHLFPDFDLALLTLPGRVPQLFASLDFGEVDPGRDIGVAGYPLAQLAPQEGEGGLNYAGLIFRVARGVVTAAYKSNIETPATGLLRGLQLVEVNFLFVPGNSGGPIFDATTGQVLAYVQSFRSIPIGRSVIKNDESGKEAGLPESHVETIHALYSAGIRLETVRGPIEKVAED